MIYDFVFTKVQMAKKDFFQWMIDTMLDAGWVNQAEEKLNIDHYSMFSTGESGEDKIGVHIRPWYDRERNNFRTTNYGLISAKAYHTYVPNPSLTGIGTWIPAGVWTDVRVTNDFDILTEIDVYYHVNKDRIIVVTENTNPVHTISATFFVFGKPYELAKSDEFNKSAVICSHGNYICRSGIIDYDTEKLHHTSNYHYSLHPRMHINGNQFAQDILIANTTDGLKYRIENIFQTNFHNSHVKVFTHDMSKHMFTDNEGRRYKLFSHNMTTNLLHAELRNFMIRVE